MRNKITLSIFAGLLAVIAVGFYFHQNPTQQTTAKQNTDSVSSIFRTKKAQAAGRCDYPYFKVKVTDLDTNPPSVIGTFTAGQHAFVSFRPVALQLLLEETYWNMNIPPGPNAPNPMKRYQIDVPMGHRVRYELVEADAIDIGPGEDGYEILRYGDSPFFYTGSNGYEPNPPHPFTYIYDTPPRTSGYTEYYVDRKNGYCSNSRRYWDESTQSWEDGELMGYFRAEIEIVSGEGGPPPGNPTRKEVGTSLALIKNAAVDLKVNGQSTAQVQVGATPNLTWTTESVSAGNSCQASNTNGDPLWVGPKNGPGGGSQLVGPMNSEGIYTYHIQCSGYNSIASSQVTIQVGPNPDDFALLCTPPNHPDIFLGSSAAFNLSTEPIGNFGSPVSITLHKTDYIPSGMPGDFEYPQVSLNPNTPQQPPSNTIAMVNTDPSVGLGLYIYTFRATGGGRTHDCIVDVNVISINVEPPGQPQVQARSDVECEKVFISFSPQGLPTPTSYKLYRGRPFTGVLLQTYGPNERLEYTDTPPGAQPSGNFYYVIAYNGNTPSQPGIAGPANINICAPDLGDSDKDLIKVEGKFTKDFNPTPCNGSGSPNPVTLPPGAIFAVGDWITFQIKVCNKGERDATNVQVVDRLYNNSNPDTKYNLRDPQLVQNVGNCANPASFSSTSNTLSFSVPIVAAGDTCIVKFKAKLYAPDNPSAPVYRFQNTGVITADGLAPVPYYTPPYLFNLTGIPEREEIPPQQ